MKTILTFAFLALFSTSAFARPVTPVLPAGQVYEAHTHRLAIPRVALAARAKQTFERRQHAQSALIASGVRDGLITAREMKRLARDQRKIERAARVAMADGVLFPSEIRTVEVLLDKADRRIERFTYNDEVRVREVVRHVAPVRPAPAPVIYRAPRHIPRAHVVHGAPRTYRGVRLARGF